MEVLLSLAQLGFSLIATCEAQFFQSVGESKSKVCWGRASCCEVWTVFAPGGPSPRGRIGNSAQDLGSNLEAYVPVDRQTICSWGWVLCTLWDPALSGDFWVVPQRPVCREDGHTLNKPILRKVRPTNNKAPVIRGPILRRLRRLFH